MNAKPAKSRVQSAYRPDYVSPPGDTIQDTLDALGMSQSDLAERTSRSVKNINQIINGKAPISPDFALQLERVFNVPAHFWNNRENRYREHLAAKQEQEQLAAQLDWLNCFPVKEMVKRGVVSTGSDKVETLRSVLNFFGVVSPNAWDDMWKQRQVAFRKSAKFDASLYALATWLRVGERLANEIRTEPYDADRFAQALTQIRGLISKSPEQFQPELERLCAQAGVAVVLLPQFPKTHANGATQWLSPTKALMMLSIRYKWADIFWFTFFHEAAHILKHAKKAIFLEDHPYDSPEEREANEFAADFLIPRDAYRAFIAKTINADRIVRFATEIGITPGIVVGRLHHDNRLLRSQMNNLRQKFEWKADE